MDKEESWLTDFQLKQLHEDFLDFGTQKLLQANEERLAIDDWRDGRKHIKSIVAITPVTADGYPADEQTREFLWNLIHDQALTEQGIASLTGQRLLPKWAIFPCTRPRLSGHFGGRLFWRT